MNESIMGMVIFTHLLAINMQGFDHLLKPGSKTMHET